MVGSRPLVELSVDEKWAEKGRERGRSVPSCSNSKGSRRVVGGSKECGGRWMRGGGREGEREREARRGLVQVVVSEQIRIERSFYLSTLLQKGQRECEVEGKKLL